jgi:hypothetical protein
MTPWKSSCMHSSFRNVPYSLFNYTISALKRCRKKLTAQSDRQYLLACQEIYNGLFYFSPNLG